MLFAVLGGGLAALALTAQTAPAWRLLAALATLLLALPAALSLLPGGARGVPVRLEWAEDGTWLLGCGSGVPMPMRLLPQSAVVGPWLFLTWAGEGGGRRHLVLDARCADERALRILRARLRSTARRRATVGPADC